MTDSRTISKRSSRADEGQNEIAFVVHSFNRAANVEHLAGGLQLPRHREIIVCDDGSLDGSRQKWRSWLSGPDEFMIFSNDLHEIRILDRAVSFATAEVICLIQDDDNIPSDPGWVDAALEQFARWPNLAIMGGFMGFNSCSPSPIESRDSAIWGDERFQFVWHVNIGPYFIRRSHYAALGGWDFSFSEAGEPGIGFDSELCLRAWLNGFQVGYMFVPVKGAAKSYMLEGGTILFTNDRRLRNQWRNHKMIHQKYGKYDRRIAALVSAANQSIESA